MSKKTGLFAAFILLVGAFTTAEAQTECTGKVTRIWTGNGGTLWVIMDSGVVWYTLQSNLDTKNILATATTAMVTDRSVTVRFVADAAPCTGVRGDVEGMWLNSQ
jgi:hypothetical protein